MWELIINVLAGMKALLIWQESSISLFIYFLPKLKSGGLFFTFHLLPGKEEVSRMDVCADLSLSSLHLLPSTINPLVEGLEGYEINVFSSHFISYFISFISYSSLTYQQSMIQQYQGASRCG